VAIGSKATSAVASAKAEPNHHKRKRKAPTAFAIRAHKILAITYSRLSTTIGRTGLASEFGMGSGVSPPVWSPGSSLYQAKKPDKFKNLCSANSKYQRAKSKIKKVIAALRQFRNFDFLLLIFELPKICGCPI
jgi:hypothetical protein